MTEGQKFVIVLTAALLIMGYGLYFFIKTEEVEDKEVVSFEKQTISPPMSLGYGGQKFYAPELNVKPDLAVLYKYTDPLKLNQIGLRGVWFVERDRILSLSDNSILDVKFQAPQIILSLSGNNSLPVRVEIDNKFVGEIVVNGYGEYAINSGLNAYDGVHEYNHRIMTLHTPRGISIYSIHYRNE